MRMVGMETSKLSREGENSEERKEPEKRKLSIVMNTFRLSNWMSMKLRPAGTPSNCVICSLMALPRVPL